MQGHAILNILHLQVRTNDVIIFLLMRELVIMIPVKRHIANNTYWLLLLKRQVEVSTCFNVQTIIWQSIHDQIRSEVCTIMMYKLREL